MLDDGNVTIRQAGDGYTIDTKTIADGIEEELVNGLSDIDGVSEAMLVESVSFGPSLSQELARTSIIALALAFITIIAFVAFAFRKTTWAIPSWAYGLIALVALAHDIIVPIGLYAVLSMFTSIEIDILFVTALLAILGYSINDTLVVFDRIRENLNKVYEEQKIDEPKDPEDRPRLRNRYEEKVAEVPVKKTISQEKLEEVIGRSLSQTIVRSINTSLTTGVVLLALFILGGEATRSFALVLLAGVIAGTYSSIFIASPLLAVIARRLNHTKKSNAV